MLVSFQQRLAQSERKSRDGLPLHLLLKNLRRQWCTEQANPLKARCWTTLRSHQVKTRLLQDIHSSLLRLQGLHHSSQIRPQDRPQTNTLPPPETPAPALPKAISMTPPETSTGTGQPTSADVQVEATKETDISN